MTDAPCTARSCKWIAATSWAQPILRYGAIALAILLFLLALRRSGERAGRLAEQLEGLPKGRKGAKFSEVFSMSANVNWLSAARVFLFGARDVWFVVGIPIYFYAVLSDGTEEGNRAAFFMIGTFMALWIILYGAVQASAPNLLRAATTPERDLVGKARGWAWTLAAIPAALVLAQPQPWLTATLVAGLLIFGAVFAVNSALHSYLILAFTKAERVTMDVGFYYMANAGGRLLGTVLSGLTHQVGGLALMLGAATAMVALSALASGRLSPEHPQVTPA